MRKAGSARKRPAVGIRWDEQNLEENELIKATISKGPAVWGETKINEPKTPYHGPLGDQHMEDVDDGLQPLELDSHHHHHHPEPEPLECGSSLAGGGATGNGPAVSGVAAGAAAAAPEPAAQAVQAAADLDLDGVGASLPGPSGSRPADGKHAHGHSHPHAHAGLHAHFESSFLSADAAAEPEPESRSGFSSDSERRASLTGGSDGEADGEESRRKFEQRRKVHYNMRSALRRARLLLSEDGEGEPVAEEAEVEDHGSGDGSPGGRQEAARDAVADVKEEAEADVIEEAEAGSDIAMGEAQQQQVGTAGS